MVYRKQSKKKKKRKRKSMNFKSLCKKTKFRLKEKKFL